MLSLLDTDTNTQIRKSGEVRQLRSFLSIALRVRERVHAYNVREFSHTKFNSEIKAPFLLNEHGDRHFLFYKFNENNILNN